MFIDKSKIKIISGAGGNGVVAWRKEKYIPKGGPAGGDGGIGGSVYIEADESLSTLLDFKYKSRFLAQNGEPGRSKNQHGKNGDDVYIKVPAGTIVRDINSNKIIGDLVLHGDKILVASGGRGGRGNARFATSIRRAPQFCEPGEPGIERDIELELKLIADIGLLGLPNAGKSTLISVISAAKPKIADYPFTTLTPNLGVVKKPSGDGFVVADIPGLIAGASLGAGLGLEFLRHVERTRLLVHLLDMTEEDPLKNYNIINQELKNYGGKLIETPQVIALNKIDAADPDKISSTEEHFKNEGKDVFIISAATGQGVQDLVNYLIKKVDEIPPPTLEIDVEEDHVAYDHDDSGFMVYKEKKTYVVTGGRIERLVSVTDLRNIEAIWRLQNILTSMGVLKALKEAGIKDGDLVRIANYEFEYYANEIREVHDEG
ncbi:MAG: GTPase ObgE [Candidatus Melainabacteria bacterium RIFOXYA12_FULL_32_12]|nr:MAG: GTPase ObgE [Candidatus Melainabacteria bacterium RIFOXYA12_FULL_32_12]